MKQWSNDPVKRAVCAALMLCLLCSLTGCKKKALPQPKLPLSEAAVNAALEKTGLPGAIAADETQSIAPKHTLYVVRDPDNEMFVAGISSGDEGGERCLFASFTSDPDIPAELPFTWADWKEHIVFATLLFGGFADEEEVYRAFAGQTAPAEEETFEWDAQLPAAYCRVRYRLRPTRIIHTFPEPIIERYAYLVNVRIYESKALYDQQEQAAEAARKAYGNSSSEPTN
ncbi:MAG: hypothetical protein VB051_03365 [Candidatus Pelethousia sp.]|nr:hypothetical protein [Candidatus Pelethousia sp.]